MKFRTEKDPLGDVRVPASAYYGAQTQRAVDNFPISGFTAPPELITATVRIKKAAAIANVSLGRLDRAIGSAIIDAADRILDGRTPRSIRRRRLSGGRRNLSQHEHQRGACQPRGRGSRIRTRQLPRGASERPRQHGPVDQRRVPDRHPPRVARDASGPRRSGRRSRRLARAEIA